MPLFFVQGADSPHLKFVLPRPIDNRCRRTYT